MAVNAGVLGADDKVELPEGETVKKVLQDFSHINGPRLLLWSPAWSDAVVICSWTEYRCTGDARVVERNWDSPRRWGDWLSTQAETPPEIIGIAFYAHVAGLMGRIQRILGRGGIEYDTLSDEIRAAFVREFAGRLDTQTGNVLALRFGLLSDHQRSEAVHWLVEDIECREDHLSTGFVGTPYLPHVLTEGGWLDVAYRLLPPAHLAELPLPGDARRHDHLRGGTAGRRKKASKTSA